jgi:hypothetical protein
MPALVMIAVRVAGVLGVMVARQVIWLSFLW